MYKRQDVCSTLYGSHLVKLTLEVKAENEGSGVGTGAGTQLVGGSDDSTDLVEEVVTTTRQTANGPEEYEVPSTLKVRIGYLGYGEPVLRKDFTFEELRSLSKLKQPYTVIDETGELGMETAVGFRLVDLVAAAGVDLNAVESFCFYSDDPEISEGVSLSRKYLIDTPRYYYPNLADKWNETENKAKPGATLDAVRVPTILAWKDYWDEGSRVPDFYHITAENRFRLVLGQANAGDGNGEQLIRWIHTIDIIIAGVPPTTGAGNIVSTQLPVQTNTALVQESANEQQELGNQPSISQHPAPLAEQNVVAPQRKVYELAQTVPVTEEAEDPSALGILGGGLLVLSLLGHGWFYYRFN